MDADTGHYFITGSADTTAVVWEISARDKPDGSVSVRSVQVTFYSASTSLVL